MPWCPQCGYEYRPDVAQCADCECELVDQDPDPPQSDVEPLNWWHVLELAAILTLAPWVWYFICATLCRISVAYERGGLVAGLVPLTLILCGVFLYGLKRSWNTKTPLPVAGFTCSVIIQVVIYFILAAVVVQEPYRLVFFVPAAVFFSLLVLIVVFAGNALQQSRQHRADRSAR